MEYFEATETDYPELVDFWNNHAGWDQLTMETWSKRFLITPAGPPCFIIGRENGKIAGQLIFIPAKITLGDKTIKGCRPFAAVVDKSVSRLKGYRVVVNLYNFGIRRMKAHGFKLLVMLPDPRWKPIARLIDVLTADFALFKKMIGSEKNEISVDQYLTKTIDFDTPAIDGLWEEVKQQHPYMVSRDREMLKWKNSHRDYKLIGIFRDENLAGIATWIEKTNEKQIQICDLLYGNISEKKAVLESVSRFLNDKYLNDTRFVKIVILVTTSLKDELVETGFVPDDYEFLFCIKRLDKTIPEKVLNISNWYLSAND